jgi:hypothetical protein
MAARELSALDAQLAARRTFPERFAAGTPDPASAERIGEFLAEVWGDEYTYSVECRSQVCRLDVEGLSMEWMQSLQEEGARQAMFEGASFGMETYVAVAGEAQRRGSFLYRLIEHRIRKSDRVAACRAAVGAIGDMTAHLDISADEQLVASYSSSLSDSELDSCLRESVDHELAEIPVPYDTVLAPWYRDLVLYP